MTDNEFPAHDMPFAPAPEPTVHVREVNPADYPQERPTISGLRPQRPPQGASRIPDNVRQPEDRKAAVAGQQAEAADENRHLVIVYNGERFEFDSDNLTFQFQLDAEQGKIATALQLLLGEEQFKKVLKWPLRHFKGLSEAIGKASGSGNS